MHDFLENYAESKSVAFEDKPIDSKFSGNDEISASKHINCYNFKDAEDTVNSFLNNVRSKSKPNTEVLIKCGFSIENLQPVPVDSGEPIVNIKYWTTDSYKKTYFIYVNLKSV